MKTGKHEAKKNEILESAFRIWGECGYRSTSLSDLAAAHEMTKQAIYRYFSSKGNLETAMEAKALEIYREGAEGLLEKLQVTSSEDFVGTYIEGHKDFLRRSGHYMAFLSYKFRRSDFGPPESHDYQVRYADLAMERAGIPGVGMRYLTAVALLESRTRVDGWQHAWNEGFVSDVAGTLPDFERLLQDASRLDYRGFEDDPLIRAVFEAVMEEAGNGVSLGKVARKAGLTKSSLYNF